MRCLTRSRQSFLIKASDCPCICHRSSHEYLIYTQVTWQLDVIHLTAYTHPYCNMLRSLSISLMSIARSRLLMLFDSAMQLTRAKVWSCISRSQLNWVFYQIVLSTNAIRHSFSAVCLLPCNLKVQCMRLSESEIRLSLSNQMAL